MSTNQNSRLAYSTATGGRCPACGWPQRSCRCSRQFTAGKAAVPNRIVAKLRVEKKGRGGKTVTVVYDLPKNDAFLKHLGQQLRRSCGTGGAVGDGVIELQGDLRDRVRPVLEGFGCIVKG